jgi:hypothetical protein
VHGGSEGAAVAVVDAREVQEVLRLGVAVVHRLLASGEIVEPAVRLAAYEWLVQVTRRELAEK